MQVMPTTVAWVAQRVRVPGFDPNKLFDSDTAINIGTWYIGHLMKRFKGDALFTAAAYNAGPEAVSAGGRVSDDPAERQSDRNSSSSEYAAGTRI